MITTLMMTITMTTVIKITSNSHLAPQVHSDDDDDIPVAHDNQSTLE